jgi:hypothetical protein
MSDASDGREPEIVMPGSQQEQATQAGEFIQQPAKLMRIAAMIKELLGEVRESSLDDAGRARLHQVYERALAALRDSLSEELQQELATLTLPLGGTPSQSEIRIAQAQLVGWLEGLFHGIQAAMFAQQAAARAQFEELRRRGLPGAQPEEPGEGLTPPTRGQYL